MLTYFISIAFRTSTNWIFFFSFLQITKFVESSLHSVLERNRLLPPSAYLKEDKGRRLTSG
jgi:hypothetical protein